MVNHLLAPDLRLTGHEFPVNGIAFSSDGLLVATSDVERQLKIWTHGAELTEVNLASPSMKIWPTERVRGIRFYPRSSQVVVASGDSVRRMDAPTGRIDWTCTAPRHWGFLITSPLSIDVNQRHDVVACFDNGSIAIWDVDMRLRSLWSVNDAPRSIRFSHDGLRLYGSDGFSVCAWDAETRQKIGKKVWRERIYGFAVSPISDLVAVRTLAAIEILDLSAGTSLASRPVGGSLPIASFCPQGTLFAFAQPNGVELFDFASGTSGFLICGERVVALEFTPGGDSLALGFGDGSVRFWRVEEIVDRAPSAG